MIFPQVCILYFVQTYILLDEYPHPRTNSKIPCSRSLLFSTTYVQFPDFFGTKIQKNISRQFSPLRSTKFRKLTTTLEMTKDHGFSIKQAHDTRRVNKLLKWHRLSKSVQQFRRLPNTTKNMVLALYIQIYLFIIYLGPKTVWL